MAKEKAEVVPEVANEVVPEVNPIMDVITTDINAGGGGSFIYDPITKTRTKVVEE